MTVSALVGETLTAVTGMETGSDCIEFGAASGRRFRMHHVQDCCEYVYLNDIAGDPADLLDTPMLAAEDVSNTDFSCGPTPEEAVLNGLSNGAGTIFDVDSLKNSYESQTWTFYRFTTIKGTVVLRWLGESNGYYSESVDFEEI